ncbi:MAG TPA: flagellar biosynthetic protein FliR [Planctomycetota bacterium]|nr:flagellar biosynthetic protein FliR [Planctomycetota bacterium]
MNELLLLHANKFMLVLVRTSGVLIMAPMFGTGPVPARIKAALILLIAVVLTPVVDGTAPQMTEVAAFGVCAVRELFLGLAMGFAAFLAFSAFQLAGELVSTQMGLTMGEIADPLYGGQSSAISQLNYVLAMLLFLAINGHHWFLQGLGASFKTIPLGGATLSAAVTRGMIDRFVEMFAAGLKLAAPAVCVLTLITLGMGMLARAAPMLNILMISMSVRIAAGLVLTGVLIPYVFSFGRHLLAGLQSDLSSLIKAM